jgi:hypothetical protein
MRKAPGLKQRASVNFPTQTDLLPSSKTTPIHQLLFTSPHDPPTRGGARHSPNHLTGGSPEEEYSLGTGGGLPGVITTTTLTASGLVLGTTSSSGSAGAGGAAGAQAQEELSLSVGVAAVAGGEGEGSAEGAEGDSQVLLGGGSGHHQPNGEDVEGEEGEEGEEQEEEEEEQEEEGKEEGQERSDASAASRAATRSPEEVRQLCAADWHSTKNDPSLLKLRIHQNRPLKQVEARLREPRYLGALRLLCDEAGFLVEAKVGGGLVAFSCRMRHALCFVGRATQVDSAVNNDRDQKPSPARRRPWSPSCRPTTTPAASR